MQQTETTETTARELTDFEKWDATPADEVETSSDTEIDTASETEPASEPESEAEAEEKKPSKGAGLKKRFRTLTSEIRELREQLAAGRPAATDKGVTTPPTKETAAAADTTGKPVAADFNTYDDYVDALTDWKLEQRSAKQAAEQEQRTHTETVKAQVTAARARYADYDAVVTDKVAVSPAMAEVMVGSEKGADIAYFLGKNPTEAARIFKLSPAAAGVALAKIEASIEAPADDKKPAKAATTKAPKPPKTLTGAGAEADAEPDPKNFTAWSKWKDRAERRRDRTDD